MKRRGKTKSHPLFDVMHVAMPVMVVVMPMVMMPVVAVMPVVMMVMMMPMMMVRRHRHIGGQSDRGHGCDADRERCREQAFLKHY
jgi:hypothetical protein